MSKENAIRFMMVKDKDEAIKNAFDAIMGKYEGKILSKHDQDKVLQEEILPLARQYGYECTLADFDELRADAKLSDEELDQITGGRGEFSVTHKYNDIFGLDTVISTYSCDYAPDDQSFKVRYNQHLNSDCPDYKFIGVGAKQRLCITCEHLCCSSTIS